MSTMLIILTLLFAALGTGALVAGAWLLRTLGWEVVDDDTLHRKTKRREGSGRWSNLRDWFTPNTRLLTYRRDELGRFRRYRH